MRKLIFIGCSLLFCLCSGQETHAQFGRADSLRGTLNSFRSCFDVTFYDLSVTVNDQDSSISGTNVLHFKMTAPQARIQLDLFENMLIDKIEYQGQTLTYEREYNAVFIDFPKELATDTQHELKVAYHGTPIKAKNAPWDGGFVWKEDPEGNPWVAVACEGIGASLWWPLKDHLSDEPDSMRFTIILPEGRLHDLMAVGNGNLRREYTTSENGHAFEWFISYPINSYNISLNIAKYAHIHDRYDNSNGGYDLDYYVLEANKDTANIHFQQVKPMMACFEQHFGPYPFPKDGYALVEVPYWGMEHQSAVAYGNKYKNNKYGFDFIIIHETGHEWWGNNISCQDHADLWIHESFCTYAEAVYVECTQGKTVAQNYLNDQRRLIKNVMPTKGPYGVNFNEWPDADMYYKGTWMLHSLRNCIQNDELWFDILREMNQVFALKNIDTEDVIQFINQKTGQEYHYFFDQFINYTSIPQLEYKIKPCKSGISVKYRWNADADGFKMPVDLKNMGIRLYPEQKWKTEKLDIQADQFIPDTESFYIQLQKL